jgi:hypothetical protein
MSRSPWRRYDKNTPENKTRRGQPPINPSDKNSHEAGEADTDYPVIDAHVFFHDLISSLRICFKNDGIRQKSERQETSRVSL